MQSKSLSHTCYNPDFTGILHEAVEYLKKHICPVSPLRINFTSPLVDYVLFCLLSVEITDGHVISVISPGQVTHLWA